MLSLLGEIIRRLWDGWWAAGHILLHGSPKLPGPAIPLSLLPAATSSLSLPSRPPEVRVTAFSLFSYYNTVQQIITRVAVSEARRTLDALQSPEIRGVMAENRNVTELGHALEIRGELDLLPVGMSKFDESVAELNMIIAQKKQRITRSSSHSFPVTRSRSRSHDPVISSSVTSSSRGTGGWRRRLSPSAVLVPGPLFNGRFKPTSTESVPGSTVGLYFGLDRAKEELVNFDSEHFNAGVGAPQNSHRYINFESRFGYATDGDDVYVTLVVVNDRRYIVGGTYDQTGETNVSLAAVGSEEHWKGDIGICFLARHQDRFLSSIPRYGNEEKRNEILRRIIDAFSKNVKDHILKKTNLQHIVRG
ncbi:hypothetical protein BDP27DRAFT_1367272 [Rhodocollybia butyracea]|uniref:Uncharacterized protein n=1 Tax=Rhodocollybia butyracea TaxID=206335 RepID=A0A9P5U2X6_9AGAR|nr:hypothetical protein BDP27DRAFT_1367272 [Rhodocollybia butyracea]